MVRFFSQCMRQKEMWNDKPGSLLNDSLSDCCQNDLLSCHVLPVFAGQGNLWAVRTPQPPCRHPHHQLSTTPRHCLSATWM